MQVKQNGVAHINGEKRIPGGIAHKTLLKTVVFPSRVPIPSGESPLVKNVHALQNSQELGALPHSTKKHTLLDRFIDKTVDALSSPKAIYVQTAITVAYMAINTLPLLVFQKFDPYPFLFLNFVYSLASGYATVFVLNSNRRQEIAAKDRSEKMHQLIEHLVKKSEEQTKMLEELTGKKNTEKRVNGF